MKFEEIKRRSFYISRDKDEDVRDYLTRIPIFFALEPNSFLIKIEPSKVLEVNVRDKPWPSKLAISFGYTWKYTGHVVEGQEFKQGNARTLSQTQLHKIFKLYDKYIKETKPL